MRIDISFNVNGAMVDDPMVAVAVLERVVARLKKEKAKVEAGNKFELRDTEGNVIGTYSVNASPYRPTEDSMMTAGELRAKYGRDGHPEHTIDDWMEYVKDRDTKLGYWDWLVDMLDEGD